MTDIEFTPKSSIGKLLWEAASFNIGKKTLGSVTFKKSTINDPHIRKIVEYAAEKLNLPTEQIDRHIASKIDYIEELKKYSVLLYDTAAKNAVEQAAFGLIDHAAQSPQFVSSRVKFDWKIFDELVKRIQLEHPRFSPLTQPGVEGSHKKPNIHYVPTKYSTSLQFNRVDTAAATSKGDFIFNTDFMQRLLDFALIENAKPPSGPAGEKYKSRGGPIPDCYVYIEFLILHEFLHYTYGDFATHQWKNLNKYSHQIHNMAQDFRSNYMLVKSGYPQLPIGLFSDHLNMDRYKTYEELCIAVESELKKLPEPLKQEYIDQSGLDSHPKDNSPPSQNPQQPSPPGKPPQQGQEKQPYNAQVGHVVRLPDGSYAQVTSVDSDGSFDVKPISTEEANRITNRINSRSPLRESKNKFLQEGRWSPTDVTWIMPYEDQPQSGNGNSPSSPPPGELPPSEKNNQSTDTSTDQQDTDSDVSDTSDIPRGEVDVDQLHKEIEAAMDKASKTPVNPQDIEKLKQAAKSNNLKKQGQKQFTKIDVKAKASISWKELLQHMFASKIEHDDLSYIKAGKGSVSQMAMASQTGSMAIKPGEIKHEIDLIKVCLVFDTSGSMSASIRQALAEAKHLIDTLGNPQQNIGVVYFSDNDHWYKVNLSHDNYSVVDSLNELDEPMEPSKTQNNWHTVLSQVGSGGTDFSTSLAGNLYKLAHDGWNIVIFSDSDIAWEENWKNFSALWGSNQETVHFVASDSAVFQEVCKKIRAVPKTWTHM